MLFQEFLTDKEENILAAWIDQILDVYPAETTKFFKSKVTDRFANPLGHILQKGLADLFRAIRVDADSEVVSTILERILLARSLEECSASKAVSFVFGLKKVVRKQAGSLGIDDFNDAWPAFEMKVDAHALLAFDIYVACRERLFNVRINEIKSGRYIMSDGAVCPSALMRKEKEQPEGLQSMNNQCSKEVR